MPAFIAPRDISICHDGYSGEECTHISSGLSKEAKIGIGIGIVVLFLLALAAGITIFCCCCRAAKRTLRKSNGANGVPLQVVTPAKSYYDPGPQGGGVYNHGNDAGWQGQQPGYGPGVGGSYVAPYDPYAPPAPAAGYAQTVTPSVTTGPDGKVYPAMSPQTTGGLYAYPTAPNTMSPQSTGVTGINVASAAPSSSMSPPPPPPHTPAPAYEYGYGPGMQKNNGH